jgi:diphthamide biosynthesis methyltransferase
MKVYLAAHRGPEHNFVISVHKTCKGKFGFPEVIIVPSEPHFMEAEALKGFK